MTNDIIIIVPKGTRVRYAENRHVDQVYVIDALQMQLPVHYQLYDSSPLWNSLPIYEAERYEPEKRVTAGPWPGIPDNLLKRAEEARRKADEDPNRDID